MKSSRFTVAREERLTPAWIVFFVLLAVGIPAAANGQTLSPRPATIRDLKIVPLAGNQETNDLKNKIMAPLVVQVLDQNDRPVEGADVTFRFPLTGPSATLADQKNVGTFRTNADGQAAATGWTANSEPGSFKIQVTAVRGNEQGVAVITMTNATRIVEGVRPEKKKWWATKWGKVAIVAGAAGIVTGIVVAAHGGGSSSGNTTVITAAPGPPIIGAPR